MLLRRKQNLTPTSVRGQPHTHARTNTPNLSLSWWARPSILCVPQCQISFILPVIHSRNNLLRSPEDGG